MNENGKTSSTLAGKKSVVSDMAVSESMSLTGGRPNPSIVSEQDKKLNSKNKPVLNHESSSKSEKTRYSDSELAEFKVIILDKLEKAQKDYEMYRSSITQSDGNDTNDTSPTFKVLEEGAATLSKEEAGKLAQRQQKFIQYLQAALVRIENKTYGVCRETGKLIDSGRLKANPIATLSIDTPEKKKEGISPMARF